MIIVIDNYDSFTYNLVHIVARWVDEVQVFRNDAITIAEISELNPDGILISPGPGRPNDAGISMEVIDRLGASVPILGVCLGHQAIGEVFGGQIVHAPTLMHGKTSNIHHDGRDIFSGIAEGFTATRYHSLVIERNSLPRELRVTAETEDGVIMAIQHKQHAIHGIQFHPESILTTEGPAIVQNWLAGIGIDTVAAAHAGSR
ncbi:MAG: aminodeoxychorismate/anthranilate synthase component II [Rhodothermia bacterium]|nr:aminodeoxychorismate/anthranilate synthase component II [Rhodothermia bacterium]